MNTQTQKWGRYHATNLQGINASLSGWASTLTKSQYLNTETGVFPAQAKSTADPVTVLGGGPL